MKTSFIFVTLVVLCLGFSSLVKAENEFTFDHVSTPDLSLYDEDGIPKTFATSTEGESAEISQDSASNTEQNSEEISNGNSVENVEENNDSNSVSDVNEDTQQASSSDNEAENDNASEISNENAEDNENSNENSNEENESSGTDNNESSNNSEESVATLASNVVDGNTEAPQSESSQSIDATAAALDAADAAADLSDAANAISGTSVDAAVPSSESSESKDVAKIIGNIINTAEQVHTNVDYAQDLSDLTTIAESERFREVAPAPAPAAPTPINPVTPVATTAPVIPTPTTPAATTAPVATPVTTTAPAPAQTTTTQTLNSYLCGCGEGIDLINHRGVLPSTCNCEPYNAGKVPPYLQPTGPAKYSCSCVETFTTFVNGTKVRNLSNCNCNIRGPKGPQGAQGEQGDQGSRGDQGDDAKFPNEVNYDRKLKELQVEIQSIIKASKSSPTRLQRLKEATNPTWSKGEDACPDFWTRESFNVEEQRVYCNPPTNTTLYGPFNNNCNFVAKFPENYDRCGWSMVCKAPWRRYGCYSTEKNNAPVPSITTTAPNQATSVLPAPPNAAITRLAQIVASDLDKETKGTATVSAQPNLQQAKQLRDQIISQIMPASPQASSSK